MRVTFNTGVSAQKSCTGVLDASNFQHSCIRTKKKNVVRLVLNWDKAISWLLNMCVGLIFENMSKKEK